MASHIVNTMTPVTRFLVALVLAAGVLTAVSPASSGATFRVRATGGPGTFRWDPDFRHIVKGNRIRWRNPTNVTHRVVAYSGPWSKNTAIGPGESTVKKFRRAGTYLYRCTVTGHSALSGGECSGMCGQIHVTRN